MLGLSFLLNEFTLLIGLFAFVIYKWSVSTFDYFKKWDIPTDKPFPFFGNSLPMVMSTKDVFEYVNIYYKQFKGSKVYGMFEMRRPVWVIRDPEVIKQMTVKDFEHFLNHRSFVDESGDAIFAKNLFGMKNQRWRDMRATLSPVFTGSKMRDMFELITDVSERVMEHLVNEAKSGDLELDSKEMASRFTNDVIATTAFGLEVNSFKDKENEFFLMGKKLSLGGALITIKIFLKLSFPKLCNWLGITLFPAPLINRFSDLVVNTMEEREKSGTVRRDVIQLLMQARKGTIIETESATNEVSDGFATVQESAIGLEASKTKWDLDDLVAQCFIFFFAGFESVSGLMCFTIQELIENPSIQERLYEEIEDICLRLDGKTLTYDKLQKMPYLDQVISESLRKWPLAPQTDRVCTKPYNLKIDEKSIPIKVDEIILVPIYGIHHDSEYFENPSQFDPDRFNDENKHLIKPFTYMPFGVGPRNCIASRFALMESKVLIFYLLKHFKLLASEKTQIPLKISKKTGFAIKPEKGFWVKLSARK